MCVCVCVSIIKVPADTSEVDDLYHKSYNKQHF